MWRTPWRWSSWGQESQSRRRWRPAPTLRWVSRTGWCRGRLPSAPSSPGPPPQRERRRAADAPPPTAPLRSPLAAAGHAPASLPLESRPRGHPLTIALALAPIEDRLTPLRRGRGRRPGGPRQPRALQLPHLRWRLRRARRPPFPPTRPPPPPRPPLLLRRALQVGPRSYLTISYFTGSFLAIVSLMTACVI